MVTQDDTLTTTDTGVSQDFNNAVSGTVNVAENDLTSTDTKPEKSTQQTSFAQASSNTQKPQENLLLSLLSFMFDPDNQQNGFSGNIMQIFGMILGFSDPSSLQGWMDNVNQSELKVATALSTLPNGGQSVDQDRLRQFSHEKPIIFERTADRDAMMNDYPGISNLLATIRDAEHSRTGDAVYNTAFGNRTADFTHMTVDQVLQWQLDNNPPGKATAAVGAYQIIRPTLSDLKNTMGLTGNEVMDKNLQDEMALVLLEKRGLFDGLNSSQLAHNLSQEWASLPKDQSGRSYYGGDGINSAQIAYNEVIQAINGLDDQSSSLSNSPSLT